MNGHLDNCLGCYQCCDKCNYDRHICGGCGEPLKHGEFACTDCRERLDKEKLDYITNLEAEVDRLRQLLEDCNNELEERGEY